MLIIPAIDLKGGQCVRLRQGDMEASTVFSDDPLAMAEHWVSEGARRLHLVDLDGAFAGEPRHREPIAQIVRRFPKLPVQVGGGIRSADIIEDYLALGVKFLIIGTQAVRDPDGVCALGREFPGRLIVGLDAVNGCIATEGWAEVSSHRASEWALRFRQAGVAAIVYTDIARDGMMSGVNIEETAALAQEAKIPVIASGGVTDLNDIQKLLTVANRGVIGAVVGRALYERTLSLNAAQALADGAETGGGDR